MPAIDWESLAVMRILVRGKQEEKSRFMGSDFPLNGTRYSLSSGPTVVQFL